MKVLSILSCGYRATLEEQDDTVVWISQSLRRAGADLDLLLRGAAANYVVEGQRVEPLAIGGRVQRNAPDVHAQVRELAESGAGVFVLEEDLERYGLADRPRLRQAQVVGPGQLAGLVTGYDSVWHW
jgi:hypothetical protein